MLIYVTMYFVSSPQMVDKILKGERAESPEAGEPQTKRFACFLFLRKSEIQFFFFKVRRKHIIAIFVLCSQLFPAVLTDLHANFGRCQGHHEASGFRLATLSSPVPVTLSHLKFVL